MDLKSAKPTIFLATSDSEAARIFYEQKLGLALAADDPYALVYQLAGTELRLSKVPNHTPLPFTVLDWQVTDIHAAHEALASPDGGAQILWFKDPDGNVLSVSERR